MFEKNIVLIGVGYVGVYVVKKLVKKYKKDKDVNIILIDCYLYYIMMIELYEVVGGCVELIVI